MNHVIKISIVCNKAIICNTNLSLAKEVNKWQRYVICYNAITCNAMVNIMSHERYKESSIAVPSKNINKKKLAIH
jgi:hypothetical protein